jgi:hypothetical protein
VSLCVYFIDFRHFPTIMIEFCNPIALGNDRAKRFGADGRQYGGGGWLVSTANRAIWAI